jgi:hypothetical protein
MPLPVLAILSCLAFLSSGCFHHGYRAEIPSSHEAPLEGVRKIKVVSANGRVRIACRPGAEGIRIAAVRFARGETAEEAREHAQAVALDLRQDPVEPEIYRVEASVPPGLGSYSCGASFDLELPPGTDLDIHTSNGAIDVAVARGMAALRTSNGEIKVTDFDGELDVKTSNGQIRLRDVAGDAITAVTSNGAIVVSLTRASRPFIKAHSSNGSIDIEVPPEVAAEVSLHTSNGSVSRELGGFRVTSIESSRRRVKAVLNGGGGRIEAETSNGGIRLRPSW